ncbi:hypothetical protein BJY59DRAFT_459738 [Rhodotorula toruloides]
MLERFCLPAIHDRCSPVAFPSAHRLRHPIPPPPFHPRTHRWAPRELLRSSTVRHLHCSRYAQPAAARLARSLDPHFFPRMGSGRLRRDGPQEPAAHAHASLRHRPFSSSRAPSYSQIVPTHLPFTPVFNTLVRTAAGPRSRLAPTFRSSFSETETEPASFGGHWRTRHRVSKQTASFPFRSFRAEGGGRRRERGGQGGPTRMHRRRQSARAMPFPSPRTFPALWLAWSLVGESASETATESEMCDIPSVA